MLLSVRFGVLLALVGGFQDSYTFISSGGVFAVKGEWLHSLAHTPLILAFVVGVMIAERIKVNPLKLFVKDWLRAILIFEIILLSIVGFIFASAQVSSFRKLVDSAYSTSMSTSNLRCHCLCFFCRNCCW